MKDKGFTLIELMVVVVIIGILAAIAIPNFLSMQHRAREASVKSNMHTLHLVIEDFRVRSAYVYPAYLNSTIINANPDYPAQGADANMCVAENYMSPYSENSMIGNNFRNPFKLANDALMDGNYNTSYIGTVFYYASGVTGNSASEYNIYGIGSKGVLPLVLTPGYTK